MAKRKIDRDSGHGRKDGGHKKGKKAKKEIKDKLM